MSNRRDFLKKSGLFASAFAFGSFAACNNNEGTATDTKTDTSATSANSSAAAGKPVGDFGLQLYSLRDDLPKDPKGVLKQVAGFGYKQLEGFEGAMGLWWGMSHPDFKKYLDELGVTMVSSHCDVKKNFDKKAGEAAEVGLKYLICPYVGAQKKLDDYKKLAADFNGYGEICKKHGLRFAYHNHGYTFEQQEGQFPQDVLMQNTDASLVDYQMDIYWVATPGQDPEAWLKRYPNRFRLCHVKDRIKGAKPEEHDASTDLGTGSIDFSKVLKTASENGMQYYIVEQERYDNSTPLKSAAADAEYMKKLLI
jgi:sugar phosphate isomerase/epimerase